MKVIEKAFGDSKLVREHYHKIFMVLRPVAPSTCFKGGAFGIFRKKLSILIKTER